MDLRNCYILKMCVCICSYYTDTDIYIYNASNIKHIHIKSSKCSFVRAAGRVVGCGCECGNGNKKKIK